jgi:hypothetical protein
MLEEQGLDNARTVATPADGYGNLVARELGEPATDIKEYQRLLGKLNCLVRATRPDIAFVVQKLMRQALLEGFSPSSGLRLRLLS